jgi:hypothetical protein
LGSRATAAVALVAGFVAACDGGSQAPEATQHDGPGNGEPTVVTQALERLRNFERDERARTDFAALKSSERAFGPDPHAVEAVDGERVVATLRASSSLVLLDAHGQELGRLPTPRSPTGLAVDREHGDVVVAGELEGRLARYHVDERGLSTLGPVIVPGGEGFRDVVFGEGRYLYAIDATRDELVTIRLDGDEAAVERQRVCAAPIALERADRHLVVSCLVDHAVVVRAIAEDGAVAGEIARIVHDAPILSIAAMHDDKGLVLALGAIEDRPLDRTPGFFANIDSYLYVYRVDRQSEGARRTAELNLSASQVVTPKALAWRDDGRLMVTGYGGERALVARLDGRRLEVESTRALPPGVTALAPITGGRYLAANPLLDAWVTISAEGTSELVRLDRGDPSDAAREAHLGEVLLFTTLMAPNNNAEGGHSRFSCETCHFEGHSDGRVHATGRGAVHATTKPLRGLFNNKPHFTRALDRDLTQVAHAEFRVAGAGSGFDPWFTLPLADRSWLGALVPGRDSIGPEELRRALMRFLMLNSHRPNRAVVGKTSFDERERAGAKSFQTRCAGCHAARLSSDDAATALPFERWEALVLDERGPLVWASEGYKKTGVEPYVHAAGARTTSLRRVTEKRPYFTNGAAKSLDEVLSRVGFVGDAFFHDRAPLEAERLSSEERAALLAFLRLL